jgi:hypothetical protein
MTRRRRARHGAPDAMQVADRWHASGLGRSARTHLIGDHQIAITALGDGGSQRHPGGNMSKPPIHPIVWQPPKAPARARQRSSATRFELQVLDLPGLGPEDVAVDADGSAITGLSDGRNVRVDRAGDVEQVPVTA